MGAIERRKAKVEQINFLLLAMSYFMELARIPEYHVPEDAADLRMDWLRLGYEHLESIFDNEFALVKEHWDKTRPEVWRTILRFDETDRIEYRELKRLLRDLATVMASSRRPSMFHIKQTNKELK